MIACPGGCFVHFEGADCDFVTRKPGDVTGMSGFVAILVWHVSCHGFMSKDLAVLLTNPKPKSMEVVEIPDTREEFRILHTRRHSQTAVMRLQPGGASSPHPSVHHDSEQTVLVLDGELVADIEGEKTIIGPRESLIIPAGASHRLLNHGEVTVVAFTVYSPPAYPAG